jgi:hypothetical protein
MLQMPVDGGRDIPSRQLSGMQTREGGASEGEITEKTPKTTSGKLFSSNFTTPSISFAAAFRGSTAQQQQPKARQAPVAVPIAGVESSTPAPREQQISGQSVRTPTVNSQPLDNMLSVVTAVQQIMTEFNGTVSEKYKIVAITKIL